METCPCCGADLVTAEETVEFVTEDQEHTLVRTIEITWCPGCQEYQEILE